MNKKAKIIYSYVRENLDSAIDNLFSIVDSFDDLTIEDKELILREIFLLLSIRSGLGGE